MKTFKKYWSIFRKDLAMTAFFQMIVFLLGMALVAIINATVNTDPDFAPLGSFLAFIVAVILDIFQVKSPRMFLVVSMGQTRRSFLICDTLFRLVCFVITMALCRLLYLIETGIFVRLYPGFENGLPWHKVFSLPIMALLAAAIAGVGLLLTMFSTRFGTKALALAMMTLWLLLVLSSRAIGAAGDGEAGMLAVLGQEIVGLSGAVSGTGWLCIGFGLTILLGAVGVLGLRRVEIRQ